MRGRLVLRQSLFTRWMTRVTAWLALGIVQTPPPGCEPQSITKSLMLMKTFLCVEQVGQVPQISEVAIITIFILQRRVLG